MSLNLIKEDFNIKIIPVLLRYDYGKKSRGDSPEYQGLYKALKQSSNEIYPFLYDEYLTKKEELQKKIIKFADYIKPDILFFSLYIGVFEFSTLDYLKNKYITINWFCDDQWRFDIFTKYQAPHFTYAITNDKFALRKYKDIGCKNVILDQLAPLVFYKDIDFKAVKYKYDVTFVGGISGYREYLIHQLKKKGVKVECFGYGWRNGRVTFNELREIFESSKINLNISNSVNYDMRYIFSSLRSVKEFLKSKKRVEQIKGRNVDIPASGGFQLTNYVPSLDDYFNIGNEVAVYISIDDLVLQINYYLNNEEERKRIMINGYKRIMNEPTYLYGLKKIFKELENILLRRGV